MLENISGSSLSVLLTVFVAGLVIGAVVYYLFLIKKKSTIKWIVDSAKKEAEKVKKEDAFFDNLKSKDTHTMKME